MNVEIESSKLQLYAQDRRRYADNEHMLLSEMYITGFVCSKFS